MPTRAYEQVACSIARTMEVLGDRWTLLIVRDVLVGVHRYDDLQRSLGVASNVLADRLTRLAEEGIVERRRYSDRPPRYEYMPTLKGRELWPLLAAMLAWGDRHYAPGGAPRLLLHGSCGGPLGTELVCGSCHVPVPALEVVTAAGPGARGGS